MMYKTNILAVSVIAMLAVVQVASAEIASRGYVDAQIQSVNTTVSGKQDTSNMVKYTDQNLYGSALENDNKYLSAKATAAVITRKMDDRQSGHTSKGSATLPVYFDASGVAQTITSYKGNAATATFATTAGSAESADSVDWDDIENVPSAFEPSAHNHASSDVNALTGYTKGSSDAALATSDSLNTALGKLETRTDSLISRISAAEGNISQATDDISTLNSGKQAKSAADYQVGNSEGGWTTLDADQIAAINSGATGTLINKITANETAIGVLNGNDQTTGSVAKQIADALNDANASNAVQSVTANNNAGVVTSIAKDGTAITMTKAKVTSAEIADNANIAKSQLASGVQTSLDYADAYHTASASYGDILTHNAAEFATAAQGNAADSAIQGVQVNGSDLNPTNGVVNVTVPTGTLAGLDAVGSAQITDGSVVLADLASGVQTSLGYADAYHAAAGTYITVPGASGTEGKSVLTYDSDTQTYYWEPIGR